MVMDIERHVYRGFQDRKTKHVCGFCGKKGGEYLFIPTNVTADNGKKYRCCKVCWKNRLTKGLMSMDEKNVIKEGENSDGNGKADNTGSE